ncbi:MAG TPA: hypothetical protein ENI81_02740 [Phycisphaerales bacterium]|nr:hypothetical protein [Phycisphaerales bacterium]
MITEPNSMPTRTAIIDMVAAHMYSGRILNNAHRGELVEMMVLAALGNDWRHVGLGWHPWDLQYGTDSNRIRVQVRQTAAVQLWGDTKSRTLSFGWKPNPPSYFERYNPGEKIEPQGWFCDLFVFGLHDETNKELIDQADPAQWKFLVISTSELKPGTNTMKLAKALKLWKPVTWDLIKCEVMQRIGQV